MSNMPKSELFRVGPVVLSYVDQLFVPGKSNQAEADASEKYSVNIIYNEQQRAMIQHYVDQVGGQAFPQEYSIPNRVKVPVRQVAEKPAYAERFPGHYFSSVKSLYKPDVVKMELDGTLTPVPANMPDPNRTDGQRIFYGGVVAYVQLNVWSFRHPKGGPVVSLGVSSVMKYHDGEPIIEGGSVDVAAAFAGVAPPPPSAMAPPQGGYAPPQQAPQGYQPPAPPQGGYAPTPQGAPQYAPPGTPQQAPQGYQPPAPPQGYGPPGTPQQF